MSYRGMLEVKAGVLAENDRDAAALRSELLAKGTCLYNLMSAPGSGKTTFLCGVIARLGKEMPIGVMEADIDSDVDAKTVAAAGATAVQLHTGGMCHLDAEMTRQGLAALGDGCRLVFLENVGNLVCPAEYDTGANRNIMILSVPEGMDKPLKYPLMFRSVSAVIINKIDALAYFDFDIAACTETIQRLNPGCAVFPVSAKTGEGMDAVCQWLKEQAEGKEAAP